MKMIVGISGSPGAGSGYVDPDSVPVSKLKSFSTFAGIMFWDVTAAESNDNFQD
jgi:hypothetical protein